MREYICPMCGEPAYSAAPLEALRDPRCPACGYFKNERKMKQMYKLQGVKPGETPEQAIIRCANNLLKAVLAAGYSLHNTNSISGIEIKAYDFSPGKIYVENILSHWNINGKTPLEITFAPHPSELVQDDAEEEAATPDDSGDSGK